MDLRAIAVLSTLLSYALSGLALLTLNPARAAAASTSTRKAAPKTHAAAKRPVVRKAVPSASRASARKPVVSRASSKSRSRGRRAVVRRTSYRGAGNSFIRGGPWREPTFADSSNGDVVDGEDPVVRRAAVDALGPYNGTVAVVDPFTGRILTLVNQKLALKSGFQPCSTIKVVAALAALSEGIIDKTTTFSSVSRRMNLTEALAVSNNPYFATLGERLGFDRVSYYSRLFGLGEKAGLDIDDEQPGVLPSEPPPSGLGMMTSFGSGITLTPLQLAALISTVANGGTLYYLQHPETKEAVESFVPRVKRRLDINQWIPELLPGMSGAVEWGTARRAGANNSESIFGKTGTCTDERSPTHLGWFGSFNDAGRNKLVVVVLLTGGAPVNGPVASGIAGAVYRNLSEQNYFAQIRYLSPNAMLSAEALR
ncbi:MAG: penicillin-binding protein [Bryobacterales bacterium]|nr:penicillin-binding protein [Bryobacterales bacterium]